MGNTSTERCIYLLYSPCSLFEQLFKAISKCLGGGHDLNQDHDHHQNPRTKTQQVDTKSPPSEAEKEMEITEKEFAVLIRRPPRPPPSSGRGGQIN